MRIFFLRSNVRREEARTSRWICSLCKLSRKSDANETDYALFSRKQISRNALWRFVKLKRVLNTSLCNDVVYARSSKRALREKYSQIWPSTFFVTATRILITLCDNCDDKKIMIDYIFFSLSVSDCTKKGNLTGKESRRDKMSAIVLYNN